MQRHKQDVHHRTFGDRPTEKMPCDLCTFVGETENALRNHLESVHSFSEPIRRNTGFSQQQRLANGLCVYWQNGHCKFNDSCRFAHEEIPRCSFDGNCRIFNCKDSHSQDRRTTSPPFLYNRRPMFRNSPVTQQRQRIGNPFLRR